MNVIWLKASCDAGHLRVALLSQAVDKGIEFLIIEVKTPALDSPSDLLPAQATLTCSATDHGIAGIANRPLDLSASCLPVADLTLLDSPWIGFAVHCGRQLRGNHVPGLQPFRKFGVVPPAVRLNEAEAVGNLLPTAIH